MIDDIRLKNILQNCLDHSIELSSKDNFPQSNSLKSSLFVSEFASTVYEEFFNYPANKRNVITVKENGEKQPGEWLLDITITKNVGDFKERILLAVESESNTSIKSFHEDFAKLLHIKAENYIYLNGLDQKTKSGRDIYISKRNSYALRLMRNAGINSFYLGFWASPRKIGNVDSIWNELPDGKFRHLNQVTLYKFINNTFKEI